MYASLGLGASNEYRGSYDQNVRLLAKLQGGGGGGGSVPDEWGSGQWHGSADLPDYLKKYQEQIFGSAQKPPETRASSMEELWEQLQPETGLPEPLDRRAEREALREEYGVAELETSLQDINAALEEEFAFFESQRTAERGRSVAMSVIEGRIGEHERTARERIDFLGRQKSRATDELNTKYTIIGQFMQDVGLDYTDAVRRYESEFSRNLQIYNVVREERKEARSQYERQIDNARANLQIYTNAITKGNLNWSDMSTDQKVMISKLEVQSGLPVGFIGSLKMSAKDRLLNINEKTGEALMIGEDGRFNVVQTGMTPSGGGGVGGLTPTQTRAYTSKAMKIFDTIDQSYETVGGKAQEREEAGRGDKMLSKQEYEFAAERILAEIGDPEMASEILKRAWDAGGFKLWEPGQKGEWPSGVVNKWWEQ